MRAVLHRFTILALPLLALFGLGRFAQAQTFDFKTDRVPIISLDGLWHFHTGDDPRWADPEFDDSAWPAASDFGALGSLPGCDPAGTFPAGSTAHWIGPANGTGSAAVLRTVIRIAPIGYAAGTTGGAGTAGSFANEARRMRSFGGLAAAFTLRSRSRRSLFTHGVGLHFQAAPIEPREVFADYAQTKKLERNAGP